jgi:YfiH family protein
VPPAPFNELGEHFAIELPGARAVFTTRRGGHSVGPYASLNLGFATDDDPGAMTRNRAELAAAIGSPEPSFTYQVHGADVRRITSDAAGVADRVDRPRADGQATNVRGVAMAALAADCLPIAIAGGGAAAMVHAGWRGLEGGVIAAGVSAVRELATQGGEPQLAAAIGPGAGPCCYEVGDEVHAAFAEYSGFRRGDNLDLKEIARRQLLAAGVSDVHDIALCTLCAAPELLYSHRRDGGVTGRQAGVAWLT